MGVGSGEDGDQIQFGSARTPRWLRQRRPRVRWPAAGAITAIVAAVAVIVAVTSTGAPRHQAGDSTGSAASSVSGSPMSAGSRGQWYDVPGPVAVRLGHPLPGEGGSGNWELLAVGSGWGPGARAPVLIRVQLAKGFVTFTSLPWLDSNWAVTVLATEGETLIRPWDVVPGYLVPDVNEIAGDPAPFWPPGTVCPDGTSAALLRIGPGQNGTVRLISLRTGAHRDIAVGRLSQNASLVWSPDSRWLFTLAANGAIEAVDVRTGHVSGLGVALPPVSYLASGTPG